MGVLPDLRVATSVSLLNHCTGYSLSLYPEIRLLCVVAIVPPLGIDDDPHPTRCERGRNVVRPGDIETLCVRKGGTSPRPVAMVFSLFALLSLFWF